MGLVMFGLEEVCRLLHAGGMNVCEAWGGGVLALARVAGKAHGC